MSEPCLWEIPGTMPAMLHAGEMVVPADFASGLRDGKGLGGGEMHLHLTVQQYGELPEQTIMKQSRIYAKAMKKEFRNFNPNLKRS